MMHKIDMHTKFCNVILNVFGVMIGKQWIFLHFSYCFHGHRENIQNKNTFTTKNTTGTMYMVLETLNDTQYYVQGIVLYQWFPFLKNWIYCHMRTTLTVKPVFAATQGMWLKRLLKTGGGFRRPGPESRILIEDINTRNRSNFNLLNMLPFFSIMSPRWLK